MPKYSSNYDEKRSLGASLGAFNAADYSTQTELIPGATGKRIVVFSFDVNTDTANTVKFVYGTGASELTKEYYLSAKGGIVRDNLRWVLPVGEGLDVIATATGNISLHIESVTVNGAVA